MHQNQIEKADRRMRFVAAFGLLMLGTGCEVTNPGPIQDEFLVQPESRAGLVNGAQRRLNEAIGWVGYTGAIVAREIMPGGQTGAYGHSVAAQGGHIQPGTYSGHFGDAQQARFIAETAIQLFKDAAWQEGEGVEGDMVAQANIWAGYANRVLGENWCEAVINGGPLEDGLVYLKRAEGQFTEAMNRADDATLRTAAVAGRAQVRAFLATYGEASWSNAYSDAASVESDFTYVVEMSNLEQATRNTIMWANGRQPYLAYTMWNTYYGEQPDLANSGTPIPGTGYWEETGDPRVGWFADSEFPWSNAALLGFGQTPWRNQTKYDDPEDPIRLASGAEMRLIQAEASLVGGDWEDAMRVINDLRATYTTQATTHQAGGEPLGEWTATTDVEAWTRLKRERAIELFLEARTLGDQRRWAENAGVLGGATVPGDLELPDFEAVSEIFSDNPRGTLINGQARLCFDVPNSEREGNPNVPTIIGS